MSRSYRRIVLAARPQGLPEPGHFRLETAELPAPAPGEVALRTRILSLDPYMRGRMNDARSYAKPVGIGETMEGEAVAEVVESAAPELPVGSLVLARTGWAEAAVLPAAGLRQVDDRQVPLSAWLGVLGMPGFTAWSGLKLIGQPKPGETVAVGAASGPVGSLVGQLAKLAGCRAVGIAGGAEKCAYLTEELGFDAAVDHRDPQMADKLAAACPNGIDIYFENIGGAVWQAVLPLLNRFARVPLCGLMAAYSGDPTAFGATDLLPATMRVLLTRSVLIRGFINYEFEAEHLQAFLDALAPEVASGRIRHREHVAEGLERTPQAFIDMLTGRNFGKTLVQVG